MLTITLFNIVHGEIEGRGQGSELRGTSLVTASAKAYLGPTFGRFVPYAGLGAGVYHQIAARRRRPGYDRASSSPGVKLKFPFGLVLRGEYQWVDHARRCAGAARPPLLLRRGAFFLTGGAASHPPYPALFRPSESGSARSPLLPLGCCGAPPYPPLRSGE